MLVRAAVLHIQKCSPDVCTLRPSCQKKVILDVFSPFTYSYWAFVINRKLIFSSDEADSPDSLSFHLKCLWKVTLIFTLINSRNPHTTCSNDINVSLVVLTAVSWCQHPEAKWHFKLLDQHVAVQCKSHIIFTVSCPLWELRFSFGLIASLFA